MTKVNCEDKDCLRNVFGICISDKINLICAGTDLNCEERNDTFMKFGRIELRKYD